MTKEEWPTWNLLGWGGIVVMVFIAGEAVLASAKSGWPLFPSAVTAVLLLFILASTVAAFRHKALPPFAIFGFVLFMTILTCIEALTADDLFVRILNGGFSAFLAVGCVLLVIAMRRYGWMRWDASDGRKAP